jgi:UDP:flavonoid glycosyltransferase YjiC (YdhE family)
MPLCDLVVSHGGHGTLMRALTTGCPVVVCPAGGDMPENAARVDWAGLGVRLAPRFCTPWGVRLAVNRALSNPRLRARAAEVARWAADHPAGPAAATELERWAATR